MPTTLVIVFKDYDEQDYEFNGATFEFIMQIIDTINMLKNIKSNEYFELNKPDGSVLCKVYPNKVESIELKWEEE